MALPAEKKSLMLKLGGIGLALVICQFIGYQMSTSKRTRYVLDLCTFNHLAGKELIGTGSGEAAEFHLGKRIAEAVPEAQAELLASMNSLQSVGVVAVAVNGTSAQLGAVAMGLGQAVQGPDQGWLAIGQVKGSGLEMLSQMHPGRTMLIKDCMQLS